MYHNLNGKDSDEIYQYCSQKWNFEQVKKLRIALPPDTVTTTKSPSHCFSYHHNRSSSSSSSSSSNSSTHIYGGEEKCIQGFSGKTWGKETTWKTQS